MTRGAAQTPLVLFLALTAWSCLAGPQPQLVKLGEERLDFPGAEMGPRIDLPYFDGDNRLRWSAEPIHGQATGDCDTATPRPGAGKSPSYPRRTVLLAPRIDERRCPRAERSGTDITLIGFDDTGEIAWQRSLEFLSGPRRIDRWLIGVSPQGLLLSDLEVWSPATGKVLVPGRTHPIAGEDRSVPDHRVGGRALYHPGRREILIFDAEVSITRRRGGLYRFDPRTGERELLRTVSATLAGTYDRVESMALDSTGRFLLLGQRQAVRGPSSVSLAVFDLDAREQVLLERHGEGQACSEPTVVAGRRGELALAYRDLSRGQHVLLHFRLEP